jgi:hypothetical protein
VPKNNIEENEEFDEGEYLLRKRKKKINNNILENDKNDIDTDSFSSSGESSNHDDDEELVDFEEIEGENGELEGIQLAEQSHDYNLRKSVLVNSGSTNLALPSSSSSSSLNPRKRKRIENDNKSDQEILSTNNKDKDTILTNPKISVEKNISYHLVKEIETDGTVGGDDHKEASRGKKGRGKSGVLIFFYYIYIYIYILIFILFYLN